MIPGEYFLEDVPIELNPGREARALRVDNLGDRPVQVGSHTHFFEVNRELRFARDKAYGFRLNIPAGTALRFEPGEGREVTLVSLGGDGMVYGMNALVSGRFRDDQDAAIARAKEQGFMGERT